MKYYTIPPSAEIASYVRFFWVLESDSDTCLPYVHRTLADGCCEMVFHYKGKFDELMPDGSAVSSSYSAVSGPTQKFNRFSTGDRFGIFGAYLYPFAASLLFGLPASALTNYMPDLGSVLAQEGRDLEEQIILAASNPTRVRLVSDFIIKKLRSDKTHLSPIVSAILHTIKMKGMINVSALASQFYLSTRQFERNFKHNAGFTPKLYSRIIRFQAATGAYNARPQSLTGIAYDFGYFDQSHFIHDFKEFSGFYPRQYFSGGNEGTAWKE